MRREQDRLDSFQPWTLSIITPAELAKAGFYYLGQGDRVACFSCGGQVCVSTGIHKDVFFFFFTAQVAQASVCQSVNKGFLCICS